ncbi:hypothetical protein HPB47_004483 [Ixodes persulcatus]|uniref:Uncharacterized protein n=1 Tax=Ixodes persulcatus TaxID=34615 RepID=A0AC60PFJ1_IXOPE|nr:hypothetical protein HPB47_004483 [Ixodes persulcatus]
MERQCSAGSAAPPSVFPVFPRADASDTAFPWICGDCGCSARTSSTVTRRRAVRPLFQGAFHAEDTGFAAALVRLRKSTLAEIPRANNSIEAWHRGLQFSQSLGVPGLHQEEAVPDRDEADSSRGRHHIFEGVEEARRLQPASFRSL